MLAKTHSVTLKGIDALECEVETNVASKGFNGVNIVGLPDAAVKESLDRIRTALTNCGYHFPKKSTLINLAPANIRKEGPSFDLPIAIGLLQADGQINSQFNDKFLIAGELALDGRIRPIKGVLSMAMLAAKQGYRGVIVPQENAPEAAVVDSIEAIGVENLAQAVGFLSARLPLEPTALPPQSLNDIKLKHDLDFADVKGQEHAKRAMSIAAAGGHNVLMIGPPGAGKSMLSQRLPSILPPLSLAEALETTRIYSAMGLLPAKQDLIRIRPVRTPHHSASSTSLVGGGSVPQPGEVSLAHNGILFLDELPEFQRSTLEMIRQPLEDATVTIARARASIKFPANFMLIAAMNPCPCGYLGHPKKQCRCSPNQIEKYVGKISGPLLDRIDIHLEVPPVELTQLRTLADGESSADILKKVMQTREIQQKRFADNGSLTNARMTSRQIKTYCPLDDTCEALLRSAVSDMGLSARAHDKILRLSRTIADMEQADKIEPNHLAEAIQYRRLDRAM